MLRKLYDMMHYRICASTQIVLEELFVQIERVMSGPWQRKPGIRYVGCRYRPPVKLYPGSIQAEIVDVLQKNLGHLELVCYLGYDGP